jgi:hypothetical protein
MFFSWPRNSGPAIGVVDGMSVYVQMALLGVATLALAVGVDVIALWLVAPY